VEERYLNDWSGTRYGEPRGLERPRGTDEVVATVKRCQASRTALAIQGGRTGVSGGAAPGDGELVLSLERMNRIEEFDLEGGVVIAGAGVILEELQRSVESEGWSFPLDLASRGTCQLGGNVATNAGGSRVLKYGSVRASILGLEAVLADGSVLGPPNRLVKNNAGYSLSSLLVGSEGTLGIVTRVALRLVPLPPMRRTALIAVGEDARIEAILARLRVSVGEALSAFEVMWPDFVLEAVALPTFVRPLPSSFTGKRVILIEVEGRDDSALGRLLEGALGPCIDDGMVLDAVISTCAADAGGLWSLRESVGEIQAGIRPYVGFDLGMPTADHDSFVARSKRKLQERLPLVRSFFFGHAGDDNLHAVVGPCRTQEVRDAVELVLYEMLAPGRSSVSAEHGIGRKKKPFLSLSRSSADIAAMRAIKHALDPQYLLNPGRVFDVPEFI